MNDATKVALVAIAIILIVGAISYANYGYENRRMDNRGTATTSNSYSAPQNTNASQNMNDQNMNGNPAR